MKPVLYDYLIIGQGIAGSVLAMTLLEQGKQVFVVDSPNENTSSAIAAGIMNPITGKRMTVSWKADEFFPEAMDFYKRVESQLKLSFLSEHPVVRVFSSIAEQNDWSAKWQDEKYQNFIKNDITKITENPAVPSPFGSLEVTGGGRLDTNGFLNGVKDKLQQQGCYRQSHVTESEIKAEEDYVQVSDITAKKVIFCTGYDPTHWGFLPFTPMKGEVLELESKELKSDKTLVGGCFLSPIENDTYYAGATYDWRNIDLNKTDNARKEILDKVAKFTQTNFTVIAHKVGIRPAVKDRRPLLGAHPTMKNTFLFSGLGSKGVSMAPKLVIHLLAYIEAGIPLDEEMDLKRFAV